MAASSHPGGAVLTPIFPNTQGRGRSGVSIEPSCQGLPAAATLAACAMLFSGPDTSCGFVAVSVSRADNTPYALNLLSPSSPVLLFVLEGHPRDGTCIQEEMF